MWWSAATLLHLVVVAIGIAHHEMWRDELQAWMLARDSASVLELLRNMRYEGHPAGWHLLLFGLSRFTRDPVAMQALHLVLAGVVAFLVFRHAPFSMLRKVLLVFGYFFVFEFAIISRSYVLGSVALFGFCAVFPARRRSYTPLSLLLVLLANTSVYGLMLAGALGALLVAEWLYDPDMRESLRRRKRQVAGSVLLFLLGATAAAVQIRPPSDARFTGDSSEADAELWRAATTVSLVWRAYVPVPDRRADSIWNTNIIRLSGDSAPLKASLALSLLLLAGAVLLFIDKPPVLAAYLLGTSGLLGFAWFVHAGALRHYGHLFLLFVACLWLVRLPMRSWRVPRLLTAGRARWGEAFVTTILVAQVVAGAALYMADVRTPFSRAASAAGWLQEQDLDGALLVGSPAVHASAIAGYLDRPIFNSFTRGFNTYISWGDYRLARDSVRPAVLDSLLNTSRRPLILIRNVPGPDAPGVDVQELVRFPAGIVEDEQYYIYQVTARSAVAREAPAPPTPSPEPGGFPDTL